MNHDLWSELKARHEGFLLLFRYRDAFTFFYGDASVAANLLYLPVIDSSLTLLLGDLERSLQVLLRSGHKIAVVEQVSATPATRQVHRIVTPGSFDE